jgi:hypothetical protein
MIGIGGMSVTVAVALPPGPVAVTVSVADAERAEGAVYNPAEVTLP